MERFQGEEQALRFASTAREYCAFVEAAEGMDTRPFQERCVRLLLRLMSEALELPYVQLFDEALEGPEVTTEEWSNVYGSVKGILGKSDNFWTVFELDGDTQPEPIIDSMADGLTDIWRDLKSGLLLADRGHLRDAVFEWKLLFETHWGTIHASSVVHALLAVLYG